MLPKAVGYGFPVYLVGLRWCSGKQKVIFFSDPRPRIFVRKIVPGVTRSYRGNLKAIALPVPEL